MVPRDLDKEILFSLTWTGNNHQLNLMAETFIDTTEGVETGDNCVLSFGMPKCKGMTHLSSRQKSVLGETIRINSHLFYNEDKQLIANKRIMIYVMDTAENQTKDISQSSAMLSINLPEVGQLTQINVPFKTREEEARTDLQGIIPFNWAAICLSVQPNAEAGRDELIMKRINGLSVFKPKPVELCGDLTTGGF